MSTVVQAEIVVPEGMGKVEACAGWQAAREVIETYLEAGT